VQAADPFCTNIQCLFNRGVTLGCTANQYCPAQFVRRDQMAAFLNRLADNLFPLTCAPGQVMTLARRIALAELIAAKVLAIER